MSIWNLGNKTRGKKKGKEFESKDKFKLTLVAIIMLLQDLKYTILKCIKYF